MRRLERRRNGPAAPSVTVSKSRSRSGRSRKSDGLSGSIKDPRSCTQRKFLQNQYHPYFSSHSEVWQCKCSLFGVRAKPCILPLRSIKFDTSGLRPNVVHSKSPFTYQNRRNRLLWLRQPRRSFFFGTSEVIDDLRSTRAHCIRLPRRLWRYASAHAKSNRRCPPRPCTT